MISVQSSTSSGVSLFGLTFLTLLVLKMTGLASFSWWWVFLPLILPFALVLGFFAVALIVTVYRETKAR